jgi:hypothetical protein
VIGIMEGIAESTATCSRSTRATTRTG